MRTIKALMVTLQSVQS